MSSKGRTSLDLRTLVDFDTNLPQLTDTDLKFVYSNRIRRWSVSSNVLVKRSTFYSRTIFYLTFYSEVVSEE